MMKSLTVDGVMALGPCETWPRERVERLYGIRPGMSAVDFLASNPAELSWDDCLWVLRSGHLIPCRVWQRWGIHCAARALPVFERNYPGDNRLRNSIATAADAIEVAAYAVIAYIADTDDAADATAPFAAYTAQRDWQRKHLLALVREFAGGAK